MSILRELRKRARQITLPVLGACVAGYFVYHGVQGDRGIIAWLVLNQQIRDANAAQDELAAERATLERRVMLLRPDSLDPDLLEERARVMLNLAHADELVIPLGPAPGAAPNPALPPAQPAAVP
jgi:cell division protein FtsB